MGNQSCIKTLNIDGIVISARSDETILEVAQQNGITIPTLCHIDGLSSTGACRMCLVEVKDSKELLPACMTPVEEGMQVVTNSEELLKLRRTILELLFSERNHVCATCVSNGHCELQDLAQQLGMDHVWVPCRFPHLPTDASHERFVIDHNRCILCTRCVKVCSEVEGAHTWGIMGRGIHSRMVTDLGQNWGTSETCTNCSKCVHVCPTGALFDKGKGAGEMTRRRRFLPSLRTTRTMQEE